MKIIQTLTFIFIAALLFYRSSPSDQYTTLYSINCPGGFERADYSCVTGKPIFSTIRFHVDFETQTVVANHVKHHPIVIGNFNKKTGTLEPLPYGKPIYNNDGYNRKLYNCVVFNARNWQCSEPSENGIYVANAGRVDFHYSGNTQPQQVETYYVDEDVYREQKEISKIR